MRDKTRPVEEICGKCKFLGTKPGSMPVDIAHLVITAYRMEALFEGGAGAPYPSVFTPLEWEAYLTLRYARDKDYEKEFPRKPKNPTPESEVQRLQQRLQRGY